jgi:DNA-binding MarR family transcriptional regulator
MSPDHLDDPVLFLLHRLQRSVLRASMAYYMYAFDLGVPQVQILHALGGRGPTASKDIADALAMNKALVSRSLRELADHGYVTSSGDSDDARLRIWDLTDTGHTFVRDARPIRRDRARKFLSVLTEEEQTTLVSVLNRLYASSESLRKEEAKLIASDPRKRVDVELSEVRGN